MDLSPQQQTAGLSRIATILAGRSLQSKTNGSYRECGKAANIEVDRQVRAGRQETCRPASGLQIYSL